MMALSPYGSEFMHEIGIDQFVHNLPNPRATLQRQTSLLQRWEAECHEMHDFTRLDPEMIDRMQFRRIRHIVDSAFVTHPFYNELYSSVGYSTGELKTWNDYHSLPTLSKTQLFENHDLFEHRQLSVDHCYSSRTSGSSGRILAILQDDGTTASNVLFYMRYYDQVLGRRREPDEWVYRIYLSSPRFPALLEKYPIFTLSQHCPPSRAQEHLVHCRPAILKAFPSYLSRMIGINRGLSELGVTAICTHSESSTQEERKAISDAFGVPVFDEYSSEELYLIATQCQFGRYHFVEDNVRVDTIRHTEAGSVDQIVATSLTNEYMPFIRYLQGDVIEIEGVTKRCECGSSFRVLSKFHGRADDFLLRRDGTLVEPDRVMGLYNDTLLLDRSGIAEFAINQPAPGSLELLVRPLGVARDLASDLLDTFYRGLQELYAPEILTFSVRVVDNIPQLPSGKRRVVMSSVTRKM